MKVLLFSNTDRNHFSYRLPLAVRLRAAGHEVVFAAPDGPDARRIEDRGFRFIPFPMSRRGLNPVAETASLRRLIRLFRSEAPDIVHSFTAKGVLMGSPAARWAGVPGIVNSITGLGYVFSSSDAVARVLRPAVERWYRLALAGTEVAFQNADDRAYFARRGLINGRGGYLIRGSGVDTQLIRTMPEAEGRPVVILAARMLWDKGVREFVEAARHVPEARFVLAGASDPGNPAAVPASQLEAWQEEGAVEWWGFREDMRDVLEASHVVCLPSLREGVPRLLLEAGAAGRPVVAADVPGCREVVRHEENGLLVPARDVGALATAIQRLVKDRALRIRLGTRGREIVESEFSIDRVAADTLRIYAGLADRISGPGSTGATARN